VFFTVFFVLSVVKKKIEPQRAQRFTESHTESINDLNPQVCDATADE
jgi:hypothetical protein